MPLSVDFVLAVDNTRTQSMVMISVDIVPYVTDED